MICMCKVLDFWHFHQLCVIFGVTGNGKTALIFWFRLFMLQADQLTEEQIAGKLIGPTLS